MTPQKTAYTNKTPQNLAGKTFGRWEVLKQAKSSKHRKIQWLCRCICGKEKAVLANSLTMGKSKSCGCVPNNTLNDLAGKTFEHWKVLKQAKSSKSGKTRWICRCICGKEKAVLAHTLTMGRSKSCGCKKVEIYLLAAQKNNFWLHARNKNNKGKFGVAAMKKVVRTYRGNAKKFGRSWGLTEDQTIDLFQGMCHYCGCLPNQISRRKNANGDYVYNGIDRVDNSMGYEPGNVVSCCKRCNYSKRNMSYIEFIRWIEQVYSHCILGMAASAPLGAAPAPPPSLGTSGTSCGGANWPVAG